MRLSEETAERLPADVVRYKYNRGSQSFGIVHFGIGAFHRAHQAWYTDLAMKAGDEGWAICGVSLRSPSVMEQLAPQDCLYTLTERSGEESQTRLVGAVREVLFAPQSRDKLVERLASPECRIVSFTVTEKGYARAGDGSLDLDSAGASFYPYLADALVLRKQGDLPGVTLLPCDNLADNGRVLKRLMNEWIAARSPDLADWFAANCSVPSTMIDRIVPRTVPADLAELEDRLGMTDVGAVFTERFSQWVIEDDFANGRPQWERHGAQLVADVAPYETAKLRMLNGAHSLLAYCGLRAGYEFVHEAVADERLANLASRLMRDEAAPTLSAAPDQDLDAYADELMERFADPALNHRLAQIAMDGTQKIPQRWLDTALDNFRRGDDTPAIREAMGAWIWHLSDSRFIDDPLGDELEETLNTGGIEALLDRCFQDGGATPAVWAGYAELRSSFDFDSNAATINSA